MLTEKHAVAFATEWIAAWNSHDLARILSHYDDAFCMSSPVVVQIAGEATGKLQGKAAVASYWRRALDLLPDLHFRLEDVMLGAGSLALVYQGHRGRAVEVVDFGENGKIVRAHALYAVPTAQPRGTQEASGGDD